jgi:hypothetical protein
MLTIEFEEVIDAQDYMVWRTVCDVLRRKDFAAHEISEAKRANSLALGLDFRWIEKGVLLGGRYERECRVLEWEPPQWICFGATDLFHVSYELESMGDRTRVKCRFEFPQASESRRSEAADLCRGSLRKLLL